MLKNTLEDLHNHLFAELERLSDEDLQGEELETEMRRAKAITGVASQIIQNGNLVVNAQRIVADSMSAEAKVPRILSGGE